MNLHLKYMDTQTCFRRAKCWLETCVVQFLYVSCCTKMLGWDITHLTHQQPNLNVHSVMIRRTSRLKLFPQKWVRRDLQWVWFCSVVVGTEVRCSDELKIKGSEQLLDVSRGPSLNHPPILLFWTWYLSKALTEIPQIWKNQSANVEYVIKKHKTGLME